MLSRVDGRLGESGWLIGVFGGGFNVTQYCPSRPVMGSSGWQLIVYDFECILPMFVLDLGYEEL